MKLSDDGLKDLYPLERKACRGIMYELRLKHCFRIQGSNTESQMAVGNIFVNDVGSVPVCDAELRMMKGFETEARNRFAEIGLVLGSIQWDLDVADAEGDNNLYWLPRPIIHGRTDKIDEIDHTRMQWETTRGLLDGQPGFIREDGSRHEEPKRKDIL